MVIDLDRKQQVFEGWGTALCWWANVIGNWHDEIIINEICDLIFHPEQGLGFNIARYNFGSGTMANGQFRNGANIPSYGVQAGQWDMDADRGQRLILKKAMDRGVNLVEGFFNSPPVWMTYSGSTAGADLGGNNLRTECYEDYVNYMAQLLRKLEETHGLKFHTLSPFNEPVSTWWEEHNNQEGCHYSVESQNEIAKLIKKTFKELGIYDIIISGAEGWSTHESIMMYQDYHDEVRDMMGQVNTHTYGVDDRTRNQMNKLMKRDQKKLWMSEVCYGAQGPQDHESMDTGLIIARNIIKDFNILQPQGWVYWQAIEDKDLNHNYGFVHASFSGEEAYELTKSYYVMGQFSKYIRPNDTILASDIEDIVCSYNENKQQLTIVIVNDHQEVMDYKMRIPEGFTLGEVIRTSKLESLQSIQIEDTGIIGQGVIQCPKESVTTILCHSQVA